MVILAQFLPFQRNMERIRDMMESIINIIPTNIEKSIITWSNKPENWFRKEESIEEVPIDTRMPKAKIKAPETKRKAVAM